MAGDTGATPSASGGTGRGRSQSTANAADPRSRAMRAQGLSRPVKSMVLVLAGILIGITLVGIRATAQTDPPKAGTAKTQCQYFSRGGPCAPIMSTYDYSGRKEGDISLVWAKLGPMHVVGTTYVSTPPVPGMYEVFKRTFTWTSAPDVEIVGVYEVHEVGAGFKYKKLSSGKHSGHATITDVRGTSGPILVLQGRRISTAGISSTATTAKTKECPLAPNNLPCHGTTIESAYAYSGYKEGDLSLVWAKLGPDRKVGTTYVSTPPVPGMREVFKRTFTWHSVASVEIVGVYEVHFKGSHANYRKLPSGKHSGHATLTEVRGGTAVTLNLQGRRI
jgi:hypothetical protein